MDGAGIVRVTAAPMVSARGHAKNAPRALMFKVFANSRNCSPFESLPRTNNGTWSDSRFERRLSSSRRSIVSGLSKIFSLTISTRVLVPSDLEQFHGNWLIITGIIQETHSIQLRAVSDETHAKGRPIDLPITCNTFPRICKYRTCLPLTPFVPFCEH
jgi:hypothetical protein